MFLSNLPKNKKESVCTNVPLANYFSLEFGPSIVTHSCLESDALRLLSVYIIGDMCCRLYHVTETSFSGLL